MLASVGLYAREHPWVTIAVIAGGVAIWRIMGIGAKWKYRRFPGRFGLPLVGDLPEMLAKDMTIKNDEDYKKYKQYPCFKVWMGTNPSLIFTDVELCRRLLMSQKTRYPTDFFTFKYGFDYKLWQSITIFARGLPWQLGRRAMEASLNHPKALRSQISTISVCTDRLVQSLDRYAQTGEPVNILICTSAMALDAVGFACFGIDLHASPVTDLGDSVFSTKGVDSDTFVPSDGWWSQHPVSSAEFGECMVRCAVYFMRGLELDRSSPYSALAMMFPSLFYLWVILSRIIPGKRLKRETRALKGLKEGIHAIMSAWRTQKLAHAKQSNNGHADKASTMQISDTGMISRVLSGDALGPDERLADYEYLGMFVTAIIAGYDTTAMSTAMFVWHIANNPAAQDKLQRELDSVTKGRTVVADHLDQLPYLTAALQETLRLNTPTSFNTREAKEDINIGQGLTRDEDIWPRAEEYLPERHLPDHPELATRVQGAFMPFGYGPRTCAGYKFAEVEVRLAVARLLQQYRLFTVPGEVPKHRSGIVYAPSSVYIRLQQRK